jgi:hypothetical protein
MKYQNWKNHLWTFYIIPLFIIFVSLFMCTYCIMFLYTATLVCVLFISVVVITSLYFTYYTYSFVTPITGLNRPNTGKEDDDDDDIQWGMLERT